MRHIGLLRAYISPSSRIPAGVGGAAALARSFYGAGSAHTTVTGEGSGSGGGSGGSRRGNHSKDDGARPSAGVEFASSGRSSEAVMRDRVLVSIFGRSTGGGWQCFLHTDIIFSYINSTRIALTNSSVSHDTDLRRRSFHCTRSVLAPHPTTGKVEIGCCRVMYRGLFPSCCLSLH